MKAINKDIELYPVPTSLTDQKRQTTFNEMKELSVYPENNTDYNIKETHQHK